MRKLSDFFGLALRSIVHRRMRSWLTVIGVFIGITAVVALISIGLGFDKTIKEQVSGVFGVDTFIIMNENAFGPGAHRGGGAEEYALDLALLRSIEGVKVAAAVRERIGYIEGQQNTEGETIKGFFPVSGLSPELMTEFESFTGVLEALPGGRLFEPTDVAVAVLDFKVSQRLGVSVGSTISAGADGTLEEVRQRFGENSNVVIVADEDGKNLVVELTVIGIMAPPEEEEESDGGGMGFGMQFSGGSDGDTISVPYDTLDLLWGPAEDALVTLVRTEPSYDVDEVADAAEKALNDRGSEISAITYTDISEAIGTMTSTISAFLVGIAGISLLVGGVGVMNTMFTSVLERTKEIGVMKAVGAKNSHVWTIFLIESGLMGLVGGVVGTVLGLGLSFFASSLIGRLFSIDMVVVASPILILATLFGSFALGAFAGLWPAWRASRLRVVDALRYE